MGLELKYIKFLKGCSDQDVLEIEKKLSVKIGEQLNNYLKKYGAIYTENNEFFGYTEDGNSRLNIVKNTLSERELYNGVLSNYIVFANDGSGDLTLIDSEDNVYMFYHDSNEIKDNKIKLNNYLLDIENDNINEIIKKIDDKIAEIDEKYVEGDARSIKELKNKEKIKYHIFGKEHELKVFTNRIYSYDKQYDENSPLNEEELDELNWLLDSHIVDTVEDKVLNYCNQNYKDIGESSISEVYPELDLREIYICKDQWHNGIAVLGECNSDPEHGISIKFENRKFSGVGQNADWF